MRTADPCYVKTHNHLKTPLLIIMFLLLIKNSKKACTFLFISNWNLSPENLRNLNLLANGNSKSRQVTERNSELMHSDISIGSVVYCQKVNSTFICRNDHKFHFPEMKTSIRMWCPLIWQHDRGTLTRLRLQCMPFTLFLKDHGFMLNVPLMALKPKTNTFFFTLEHCITIDEAWRRQAESTNILVSKKDFMYG